MPAQHQPRVLTCLLCDSFESSWNLQLSMNAHTQVKGSGIANTCPVIEGGSTNLKDLKAGTYK